MPALRTPSEPVCLARRRGDALGTFVNQSDREALRPLGESPSGPAGRGSPKDIRRVTPLVLNALAYGRSVHGNRDDYSGALGTDVGGICDASH